MAPLKHTEIVGSKARQDPWMVDWEVFIGILVSKLFKRSFMPANIYKKPYYFQSKTTGIEVKEALRDAIPSLASWAFEAHQGN